MSDDQPFVLSPADLAFVCSLPRHQAVIARVLQQRNPSCSSEVTIVREPGWSTIEWNCTVHKVSHKTAVRSSDNLTFSTLDSNITKAIHDGQYQNPCDGYGHPVKFLSLTPRILPPQGTQF